MRVGWETQIYIEAGTGGWEGQGNKGRFQKFPAKSFLQVPQWPLQEYSSSTCALSRSGGSTSGGLLMSLTEGWVWPGDHWSQHLTNPGAAILQVTQEKNSQR